MLDDDVILDTDCLEKMVEFLNSEEGNKYAAISAFISNNGKILEKQGYFEDKMLKKQINLYEGKTFYAKYGNLPLYLILSVIFIVIFILKRKKELY